MSAGGGDDARVDDGLETDSDHADLHVLISIKSAALRRQ